MKTVLVIETNSAGNGTRALEAAHRRGLRTHFLTRTPREYDRHEVNPLDVADEVSVVETFDVVKIMHVLGDRDDYAAVCAYDELRVVQSALVAEQLGLAGGPRVSAALKVRFKDLMRSALRHTPYRIDFQVIGLDSAKSPLPFPCVVKPTDEAASVGVSVCRDEQEFKAAMELIRDVAGRTNGRGYQRVQTALVEQYVPGDEFSAEMVWSRSNSRWELIGITAKSVTDGSAQIETGHLFPHSFGPELDVQVLGHLRRCLEVLGLRETLVHVEFRLDGDRFGLIEVNPRPAGGGIDRLVAATCGVSLVELHLAAHLGLAHEMLDGIVCHGAAGIRNLLPPHEGTITHFDVLPPAVGADADDAEISLAATPLTVDGITSNEARIGRITAWADTAARVRAILDAQADRVRPRYGNV